MKGMIITGIFFVFFIASLFGIDRFFMKSVIAKSISKFVKEITRQTLDDSDNR